MDRLEVGGSCKRERGRGGGERPAVIAELLTAVMVVGRSPRCLPPSSVLSHVAQVSRIIRIRDRRPAPERHGWTARLEMITKLVLVDENVADGTRSIQPMGVGILGCSQHCAAVHAEPPAARPLFGQMEAGTLCHLGPVAMVITLSISRRSRTGVGKDRNIGTCEHLESHGQGLPEGGLGLAIWVRMGMATFARYGRTPAADVLAGSLGIFGLGRNIEQRAGKGAIDGRKATCDGRSLVVHRTREFTPGERLSAGRAFSINDHLRCLVHCPLPLFLLSSSLFPSNESSSRTALYHPPLIFLRLAPRIRHDQHYPGHRCPSRDSIPRYPALPATSSRHLRLRRQCRRQW